MDAVHCTRDTNPGVLLSVSIPLRLRTHLAAFAMAHARSMSDVVNKALIQYLALQDRPAYTVEDLTRLAGIAAACRNLHPPLPVHTPPGKEYVYFIRAQGTEYVKIGRSLKPETRLGGLQVGSMWHLEVAAKVLVMDAFACEHYLHQQLHDWHMQGEWFALPPSFLALFSSETYRQS
jgi:hypothetical protein